VTVVGLTNANIVLIAAAIQLAALRSANRRLTAPFPHRDLLKIAYLLALCEAISVATSLGPYTMKLVRHAAEVWSSPTMDVSTAISASTQRLAVVLLGSPTFVPFRTSAAAGVIAFSIRLVFRVSRIYLLRLLQGVFFWNPAVHILVRQILLLQELACDETVTPGGPALRTSSMSVAWSVWRKARSPADADRCCAQAWRRWTAARSWCGPERSRRPPRHAKTGAAASLSPYSL
jgi:beta-lactamase regulating signal transducer with metallopeptidase domain